MVVAIFNYMRHYVPWYSVLMVPLEERKTALLRIRSAAVQSKRQKEGAAAHANMNDGGRKQWAAKTLLDTPTRSGMQPRSQVRQVE